MKNTLFKAAEAPLLCCLQTPALELLVKRGDVASCAADMFSSRS